MLGTLLPFSPTAERHASRGTTLERWHTGGWRATGAGRVLPAALCVKMRERKSRPPTAAARAAQVGAPGVAQPSCGAQTEGATLRKTPPRPSNFASSRRRSRAFRSPPLSAPCLTRRHVSTSGLQACFLAFFKLPTVSCLRRAWQMKVMAPRVDLTPWGARAPCLTRRGALGTVRQPCLPQIRMTSLRPAACSL